MTLREHIVIQAAPQDIWPFVADPVRMSTWNSKIIAVDRDSDQPVCLGERFNILYRMSGKEAQMTSEVVACREPCEVTFRHRDAQWTPDRFVDESYALTESRSGTRVLQSIDLRASGIAWPFRLLIWWISRFGKPVDTSAMQDLKSKVESSASPRV